MRTTSGLARVLVGGLVVLSLVACGDDPGPGGTAASEGASPSATTASPTGAVDATPSSPKPYRAVCAGADPVAVGVPGPVDAALGRRFLLVQVRNCSDADVTLSRPVVTAVDRRGDVVELEVTPTPTAGRPETSPSLAPGATAYAGLSWRGTARTSRVRGLSLAATPDDRPDRLRAGVLDLGPRSRVDLYPWQPGRDGVFG